MRKTGGLTPRRSPRRLRNPFCLPPVKRREGTVARGDNAVVTATKRCENTTSVHFMGVPCVGRGP